MPKSVRFCAKQKTVIIYFATVGDSTTKYVIMFIMNVLRDYDRKNLAKNVL